MHPTPNDDSQQKSSRTVAAGVQWLNLQNALLTAAQAHEKGHYFRALITVHDWFSGHIKFVKLISCPPDGYLGLLVLDGYINHHLDQLWQGKISAETVMGVHICIGNVEAQED